MASTINLVELRGLKLDSKKAGTRRQQLYLALRQSILDGSLTSGSQLPSSRDLASQLSLGRNTVIGAYEQLKAEGYIQSHTGAGSFVASALPEFWQQAEAELSKPPETRKIDSPPNIDVSNRNGSFCVGVPDLKSFPIKIWNRLSQQIPPAGLSNLMGFGPAEGNSELRNAVAAYVRASRAVNCSAEQVLITSGAQQALDLCCRLLLNKQDHAAMEDPGYQGMHRAMLGHGAKPIACPVDQDGIDVAYLKALPETPKLVYITPANQYPLGSVLPLSRKLELLEWAEQEGSWILEDDYDSEYHYQHRPLASLQGLDKNQNVIYMGSFSKTLFPGLRLGYLILPEILVQQFSLAKNQASGETPPHTQAVTAAFINEGHFHRHLRRMRVLYSEKLVLILKECATLPSWVNTQQRAAGLHIVIEFNNRNEEPLEFEKNIHHQLTLSGIFSSRLSEYYLNKPIKTGLALGFANSSMKQISAGISCLKKILET